MVDLGSVFARIRSVLPSVAHRLAPSRVPGPRPFARSVRRPKEPDLRLGFHGSEGWCSRGGAACGSAATSRRGSVAESPASSTPDTGRDRPPVAQGRRGRRRPSAVRERAGKRTGRACARWRSRAPGARRGTSRRGARQHPPRTDRARRGSGAWRRESPRRGSVNAAPTPPPGDELLRLKDTRTAIQVAADVGDVHSRGHKAVAEPGAR